MQTVTTVIDEPTSGSSSAVERAASKFLGLLLATSNALFEKSACQRELVARMRAIPKDALPSSPEDVQKLVDEFTNALEQDAEWLEQLGTLKHQRQVANS